VCHGNGSSGTCHLETSSLSVRDLIETISVSEDLRPDRFAGSWPGGAVGKVKHGGNPTLLDAARLSVGDSLAVPAGVGRRGFTRA
jgi:hypothetical protein